MNSLNRTLAKVLVASVIGTIGALGLPLVAQADFSNIELSGGTFNADKTTYSQAAGHPYEATARFAIPSASEGFFQLNEQFRTVEVDLPAGLVGNPAATPTRCTAEQFSDPDLEFPDCPASSQVGLADILLALEPDHVGFVEFDGVGGAGNALYNLVPPPGTPAMFGFRLPQANFYALLIPHVRVGGDYGLTVVTPDAATGAGGIGVAGARVTFWGSPTDPVHDVDRGTSVEAGTGGGSEFCGDPDQGPACSNSSGVLPGEHVALLTNPSNCSAGPLTTTMRVNSWQNPDIFHTRSFNTDENGNPTAVTGCDQVPFEPAITAAPTTDQAETPTGLDVDISVPTEGLLDPEGISQGNLKKAVVTLPQGMTVNPSSANGLGACSSAQVDLKGPGVANCPTASRIGTVEVESPLIDHPLPGSVYLAAQNDNPFNSLLAIYIAIDDPQTGIIVKLAGHVVPDPNTGQLTATFDQNPQLPFEHFRVNFFGGPRASLKTPATCGSFTITTQMVPWSAPEGASAAPSSSFAIGKGAGGGSCLGSASQAPNNPSFTAGTLDPTAGIFSPFVLKLARADGSQQIKGIDATLPKGLIGRLAGTPYCPEAAIAGASSKSGKAEQASPSCPLASQVGSVNVGAGAGSDPLYVPGKAYLAGPYKGAPLSMAVITPAVAGPFDLGNVVTRVALQVDPNSTQIHAVSDPLPTILQGIPLELRSVSLRVDKPQFTLNPTNCDPMAVTGSALSVFGQAAALSNPFQVGDCARLAFKPQLSLRLKGGTKRDANPALTATLTYPKGLSANIKSASVALPRSEFLDQSHIGTICTRVQYAADACPARSVYGFARASSPLLEQPLEGPVYLRSSNNPLPDLVAALKGQIDVDLVGRIDTVRNGIRTTFDAAPDAPVSKFTLSMKGGKKGLLVNSRNICNAAYRATAVYEAHSGKAYESRPLLKNGACAKAKKKAKKRGNGKKG